MTTLLLKATVTENRQLKVDLPTSVPIGAEFEVILNLPPLWTPEELAQLMHTYHHPTPVTGTEMAELLVEIGNEGWDDIEDSVAWVAEQRAKRRGSVAW